MDTNHVITKTKLTAEDVDFLEDRLYEYNCDKTGQSDGQLFGFLIRDEKHEIIAGLSGWTWAQACQITMLWVNPTLRGQGYGHHLLEAAEQEARAHGCTVILLDTYSFQAPVFYQKHGFELVYQLQDFPPGHQANWLVKRLG